MRSSLICYYHTRGVDLDHPDPDMDADLGKY